MGKIHDLSEDNKGLYQWLASKDGDGDFAALGNTKDPKFLVVHVVTKDGRRASALISRQEFREMTLAGMDMMDGIKPQISSTEDSL